MNETRKTFKKLDVLNISDFISTFLEHIWVFISIESILSNLAVQKSSVKQTTPEESSERVV